MNNSQFGFRNIFGIRRTLSAIKLFYLKKCIKWCDQRKDVFAYFIDYEKAFDRIRYEKLIEILEELKIIKYNKNIDNKNIRIIKNLYWK